MSSAGRTPLNQPRTKRQAPCKLVSDKKYLAQLPAGKQARQRVVERPASFLRPGKRLEPLGDVLKAATTRPGVPGRDDLVTESDYHDAVLRPRA